MKTKTKIAISVGVALVVAAIVCLCVFFSNNSNTKDAAIGESNNIAQPIQDKQQGNESIQNNTPEAIPETAYTNIIDSADVPQNSVEVYASKGAEKYTDTPENTAKYLAHCMDVVVKEGNDKAAQKKAEKSAQLASANNFCEVNASNEADLSYYLEPLTDSRGREKDNYRLHIAPLSKYSDTFDSSTEVPWYEQRYKIRHVVIETMEIFGTTVYPQPKSTKAWFGCIGYNGERLPAYEVKASNIETFNGMSNLDMTNCKDASFMFTGCTYAKNQEDDDHYFNGIPKNMTNVQNAYAMFTFTNFSTDTLSGVVRLMGAPTNMSFCFAQNQYLQEISFDDYLGLGYSKISKATNLSYLLLGNENLTTVKALPKTLETSRGVDASAMFAKCPNLTTIEAETGTDWSKNTRLTSNNMFAQCSENLKGDEGTQWNEYNPTDKTYAKVDGDGDKPGYFTDPNKTFIDVLVNLNGGECSEPPEGWDLVEGEEGVYKRSKPTASGRYTPAQIQSMWNDKINPPAEDKRNRWDIEPTPKAGKIVETSTLTCNWMQIHSINWLQTPDWGEATASPDYAIQGETVKITYTPNNPPENTNLRAERHKLTDITITTVEGDVVEHSEIVNNQVTFIMPDSNVHIQVDDNDYDWIPDKMLNKYTMGELKDVANDLAKKGEKSDYYPDFKYFLDNGITADGHDNGTQKIEECHWAIDKEGNSCGDGEFDVESVLFEVRIVGICEDFKEDGKPAGLTFMTTHRENSLNKYHPEKTCDCWENSSAYSRLNNSEEPICPFNLFDNITEVVKSTSTSSGTVTKSKNKLFYPGMTEMFGPGDHVTEGTQYAAFKNMGVTTNNYTWRPLSRLLYNQQGGSENRIWMRSISSRSSAEGYVYNLINSGGNINIISQNPSNIQEFGNFICFCF